MNKLVLAILLVLFALSSAMRLHTQDLTPEEQARKCGKMQRRWDERNNENLSAADRLDLYKSETGVFDADLFD